MVTPAPVPQPATATAPPPSGELRDVGTSRRDAVRARQYTALGAVKILGELTAEAVALSGFVTVGGPIRAERLASDGTLAAGGDVEVRGEATFRGPTEILGRAAFGEVRAAGNLRVRGPLTVEGVLRLTGRLEAAGPVTARALQFDGRIEAPGVVESPTVEGRLRGPSRIGTLRAAHVRLVAAPFPFGRGASLAVDRIEAVDVDLAHVDCGYLRAERVRLGRGAHVTRIDGNVVARDPSASVGPRVRSRPVFGLTR